TTLQTQVEVPDLRGLSLDEATNIVNSRGLLLNRGQPVFSDSVPAGAVAEQAPPSGSRVEQGFVVSVSPSNGSANVDLASLGLVGMGVEEAVQRLTSRGLTVANEEVGSPDVAAGKIVSYVPPGGVVVGETVTLLVSVGDQVRVPIEIHGRPVERVMAEIQGLGLVLLDPRGVDRDAVSARVDMDAEEIVDRDVIEVQHDERAVNFGAWVPRGSRIALVFYDRSLD
ncbi:MAG: PASTA domain-containing protein, partial [Chloroflexia bacterium]|nr:PASTA domain-containing protein [Chloroflexia bacterium]